MRLSMGPAMFRLFLVDRAQIVPSSHPAQSRSLLLSQQSSRPRSSAGLVLKLLKPPNSHSTSSLQQTSCQSGACAGLVLKLFIVLLPHLLHYLNIRQGMVALSEVDAGVIQKFFIFQVGPMGALYVYDGSLGLSSGWLQLREGLSLGLNPKR